MVWSRIRNAFMIISVFGISIIANLAVNRQISLEFAASSIVIAGIFYLILTLEEKHDRIVHLLTKIEENTRLVADGGVSESTENAEAEEEEINTSGAGAFLGLLIGGMLGLSAGGIGVLIGGIIGGIIGDTIEYESLKEKKKKAEY